MENNRCYTILQKISVCEKLHFNRISFLWVNTYIHKAVSLYDWLLFLYPKKGVYAVQRKSGITAKLIKYRTILQEKIILIELFCSSFDILIDKILRFPYLVYGKEDYDYRNKKRPHSTRLWNFFLGRHHKKSKKTYDWKRL